MSFEPSVSSHHQRFPWLELGKSLKFLYSKPMIDHIALQVSDFKKSLHFYDNALAPLGYKRLMEVPQKNGQGVLFFGWGDSNQTDFWISEGLRNEPRLHIAFRADNHEQVDEFYRTSLTSGGKDNGKPGLRTKYHENYYGAFILDPDDHNIEAVCHTSNSSEPKAR